MENHLIEVQGLKKYFQSPTGKVHAVDGIDLSIEKGKTLGVVGESGCGKSTLGRTILRLLEADGGSVKFQGQDVLGVSDREMKKLRQSMQIIMQDPYASLNPRMTVFDLIAHPLRVNHIHKNQAELTAHVEQLMETVGLAEHVKYSYPHELDGGRRQRIGIARALALEPKFIVCDEPVSALDVSIQAQILNLMMDLQAELGLTYLFISHNLAVVKHISDEIMVMYLGRCVERAPAEELFEHPMHPYTRALLDAVPRIDLSREHNWTKNVIKGELTSPIDPPPGCRFASRCPYACDSCRGEDIPLVEISNGHYVACHKCLDLPHVCI